MKRFLIAALDWFDATILGHRYYSLCQYIGSHPWWGIDDSYNDPEPPKAA